LDIVKIASLFTLTPVIQEIHQKYQYKSSLVQLGMIPPHRSTECSDIKGKGTKNIENYKTKTVQPK
jgi:hypothetical protein